MKGSARRRVFLLSASVIASSLFLALVIKARPFGWDVDFWIYGPFLFQFMPLSIAMLAYTNFQSKGNFKKKLVVFLGLSALTLAGSLFHDFLWTAHRTNFYTKISLGGTDLLLWEFLTGRTDYNSWGIYAAFQSLAFIVLGAYLLGRFYRGRSFYTVLYLVKITLVLGVGLFFLDIDFNEILFSLGTFFVILSAYLFTRGTKKLATTI